MKKKPINPIEKNIRLLLPTSILIIVIIIGAGYFYSSSTTQEIEPLEKDPVQEFINSKKVKTPDVKEEHEKFISSLESMLDAYEDIIDDYNDDPSDENHEKYRKTWRRLGGITMNFDNMSKTFSKETFLSINTLILEIDDIMREKGDANLIEEKIEAIEDLVE